MFKYRKQLNAAGSIYLGQFAAGYAAGWSRPALAALQAPSQSTLPRPLTPDQAAVIHYLIYLGLLTGPYPMGRICNARGHRASLFAGATLAMAGFCVIALADSASMLRVGRALSGTGAVATAVYNVVYIGEIACPRLRGVLVALLAPCWWGGLGAAHGLIPRVWHSVSGWFGVGACVLHIAAILALPESPLYLAISGQKTAAKETLLLLNREDEIDETLSLDQSIPKSRTDGWRQLFSVPNKNALLLTLILNILQQMSGIPLLLQYLQALSDGYLAGSLVVSLVCAVQIVSGCIAAALADWAGRRCLLICSTSACCVCLLVLGILSAVQADSSTAGGHWVSFAFSILYFAAHSFGFGCIPTVLLSEVFTPRVRGLGCTVVSVSAWAVGLGAALLGLALSAFGLAVPLLLSSAACLVALLFIIFCVPETKGKSLSSIVDMMK